MKQVKWTDIGLEEVPKTNRKLVSEYIDRIEWQRIPKGGSLSVAMMPGENIKEVIKQLKLRAVTHIAISHDMAPFGLYGVRNRFKNGVADIFMVDNGCEVAIIRSDFIPKDQARNEI